MLRLVIRKVSMFSAAVIFAFALLMVDTDSPTLISEAHACDMELYWSCFGSCGFACVGGSIPECNPHQTQCDCEAYCHAVCLDWSGCG